jgi:hypothetical protein
MPHGFFTIEQWRNKEWVAVCHLDASRSVSDALKELEGRGKPGFFRVVQTQRMIWAEKVGGKLRLRKWHAGHPYTLEASAKAYDRSGGRWPVKNGKSR